MSSRKSAYYQLPILTKLCAPKTLLGHFNTLIDLDHQLNLQVIMATNRHDTLDPALLRPGRLDRKIEFPTPDRRQKRLIFSTICGKMNLSNEIDFEDFVARRDKISGADLNAICQEVANKEFLQMFQTTEIKLLCLRQE